MLFMGFEEFEDDLGVYLIAFLDVGDLESFGGEEAVFTAFVAEGPKTGLAEEPEKGPDLPTEGFQVGSAQGGTETNGVFVEAAFDPLVGTRRKGHFELAVGGKVPNAVSGANQKAEDRKSVV